MFTGLIESTGSIVSCSAGKLKVKSGIVKKLSQGDSIAIDGVCLTVETIQSDTALFHFSPETASSSVISAYYPGLQVNLERPLSSTDRLHGHIVQGHVDCIGQVLKKEISKGDTFYRLSFPPKYEALIVEKGSIAINGISLTAVSVGKGKFSVVIIPETMENTNAGKFLPGSKVNLEFDIIGKYVQKQTEITGRREKLRNYLEE